jgi:probable addiction module antidote protein
VRTSAKGWVSPTVSYRDELLQWLRIQPERRAGYLNAAWMEGPETFLVALKNVVDAQGGVTRLAKKTGLHRVSLHTLLSAKGNPRLDNLSRILSALKIRATFGPQAAARRAEPRRKKKAG